MGWRQFATDYLSFTRRDRIAVITLLLLILVVFFLPVAISSRVDKEPVPADSAWISSMNRLMEHNDSSRFREGEENSPQAYQYDKPRNNEYARPKGELFYFDPNVLPASGWKKLGLRDKTIATIQNFTAKGGKFRKPEDLQRIYGLFPDEYERIAPFINIEAQEKNEYKQFTAKDPASFQPAKTFTGRYAIIDINSADTSAFIMLPGIGSKLASRIVNFRDKLGGFLSINQVAETFGLPDSTFQKIKQYLKLENIQIRKININTATLDELKLHPYIRYGLAKPIIAYRELHGSFAKLEELKNIMVITDEIYRKIHVYLSVD